jgi:hypothetical protein
MKAVNNTDISSQIEQWVDELICDNPLLMAKLTTEIKEADESQARLGLIETLRFLWLCSQSNAVLTPSIRVDKVWHELILFTRSYQAFCETHLGHFVHHQPSDQPSNELKQYSMTLVEYKRYFGHPSAAFWPQVKTVSTKEASSCGTCEN